MNIQLQCCGLVMMGFLLYFNLRQKRVGLFTEKIFTRTLLVAMVCVTMDILSIVAITYSDRISGLLLAAVCKTYIVTLVWTAFSALVYVLTDLYEGPGYYRSVRIHAFVAGIGSVLIYILPIYYFKEGRIIYTYGPSTIATYVFALLFIADTFCRMFRNAGQMNPRRKNAVLIWMTAWLAAAAIQFTDNRLLVVGFACSIGMLCLFCSLENPEANMDRQVGCFNSHVLLEYMRQCYQREENFSLILISLAHYAKDSVDMKQTDVAIREIAAYLKKYRGIKVFKRVEQELALVFENAQELQDVLEDIREQFRMKSRETGDGQSVWPLPLFIVIPDSTVANSAEEVFRLLRYFKMENRNLTDEKVIYIDREEVDDSRKNEEMKHVVLDAIAEDRVEVFFQPIYSNREKSFVSAEALVRIRNTDGSILPPGMFISAAEETGLISELGEIVFEKTCRFIKENNIREYGIRYIEINLSVIQCEQWNLAETYMRIMKKYEIDPSCINLEITETASIQTKKNLLENMRTLMDYGVSFSLDDFGSGRSNLNYLIDMPVSILKIDQDMTKAYFETMKAQFVVEAAVNMVHNMRLEMVAEGVETKKQLETMERIGVDYIQGFYFSKPLPEDMFLEFILSHQKTGGGAAGF